MIRNRTLVDAELLEAATRLTVIGRLGVGLDNIDVGSSPRSSPATPTNRSIGSPRRRSTPFCGRQVSPIPDASSVGADLRAT